MTNTTQLKRFAQYARETLRTQVTAKMALVLDKDSLARRENPKAVKELEKQIEQFEEDAVIEQVAYTWFNRFCALRFMDVNRYTRIGIVSPAEGHIQPEILAEAKQGHIDESLSLDTKKVFGLLNNTVASDEPQQEAYRLLLVAACNHYHRVMPFLFERIADYTELLLPDDLLSGTSIVTYVREAMFPDICKDVEIIGWLYQFYISTKKDDVFAALKKGKKITPENIPAATQLFTPHWIVKYLVENSLGRLWMLNRPQSKLKQHMEFYIESEQAETDFLKLSSPEEIKICDPACGSGHMLTYAFDLLYLVYEEEGYELNEIPRLILENNLYGIEIDERAGELAALALVMKARRKYKRFLAKPIQPHICVLKNIRIGIENLKAYVDEVGQDLFTANLYVLLQQFEEADNVGSLIRPAVTDVEGIRTILEDKNLGSHMYLSATHTQVLEILKQADYLGPKYHVVIANPPYMGQGGMNERLKTFAKNNFSAGKADLYAMFIERALKLVLYRGSVAMITMQGWMFLSSFEKLRFAILQDATILSMAHLGARAFDSIGGEVVQTTAFVVGLLVNGKTKSAFLDLTSGKGEQEKQDLFQLHKDCPHLATLEAFKNIPGLIIAYAISDKIASAFEANPSLGNIADPKQGLATMDNERFLRSWHEVTRSNSHFTCLSSDECIQSKKKWFPVQKGGEFRRWYGNNHYLINWEDAGKEICDLSVKRYGSITKRVVNRESYFKKGLTFSRIGTGTFSVRYMPVGFIFETAGCAIFPEEHVNSNIMGYLNSSVAQEFIEILAPTLTFQVGDIAKIPVNPYLPIEKAQQINCENLVDVATTDWDSYETSWGFTCPPLLNPDCRQPTLQVTYQKLRAHWREITLEMQRLEEENNRIFIEAYGLQDELMPDVPLNEITLTCNPHYRYSGEKSDEELEAMLLADTMRELVSYAVGCMFGRYALDKPGLILANQGETIEDYLRRVPEPSFLADDDNVIPMLDDDWFTDDITERFREFLRVAFGEEHYEENLQFIEKSLGKNGKPRDIRHYFLKDFYGDHVKRYKKRPIYWLFSSPKGGFNALIYMHRYRPDTVSVVLNDYLREFRTKLTSEKNRQEALSISTSASQGEKTEALKKTEKIKKMIVEMEEYDREVLHPKATEQVPIDLDEGVKVNYPKFGKALKKIAGLS